MTKFAVDRQRIKDPLYLSDSAKELIVGEFGQNALRSVVYDTSFANNPSFMLTQNGTCYPVMEVSAVPDGPGNPFNSWTAGLLFMLLLSSADCFQI